MSLEKNPSSGMIMELFGPTVEFLTSPQDAQNGFCVLLGTIPPGVFVPPHSHADIAGSTYSFLSYKLTCVAPSIRNNSAVHKY